MFMYASIVLRAESPGNTGCALNGGTQVLRLPHVAPIRLEVESRNDRGSSSTVRLDRLEHVRLALDPRVWAVHGPSPSVRAPRGHSRGDGSNWFHTGARQQSPNFPGDQYGALKLQTNRLQPTAISSPTPPRPMFLISIDGAG
ncbi:unnamed protein product [Pleuronectes platessa]|uniref:Uncharacterized protein n=1 Tax=Pleuronectes platessa TaxID=8262 RepID=A0A9N7UGE5_PLEPL|nr:unnamed protein product [Pleuronectes platessa]